jgi:deoxyribodipyrimidine photo-lyase
MSQTEAVIFWFRRDLRLNDNRGLHKALTSGYKVLPLFVFDTKILSELEPDDARVSFICDINLSLHKELKQAGSGLITCHTTPDEAFRRLITKYRVKAVYTNRDYEPYATRRDSNIKEMLSEHGTEFIAISDQLIFEPGAIRKSDGMVYTVFTPYSRRWLSTFNSEQIREEPSELHLGNLMPMLETNDPPTPEEIGFTRSDRSIKPYNISPERIDQYAALRNFPAVDATTGLGPHLRFGTIGIREVLRRTTGHSDTFVSELIWREFFTQILSHFPHAAERSFKAGYDQIEWINNEEHFDKWCNGMTGYPIVDAGMRELSTTGYMHNRVRMITAGFLVKHLLCDWRWGEAWFASKLNDFELSSNNGNWQWAAGSGCDAAPYFRVFSPDAQQKKFDRDFTYIKRWVPEYDSPIYPPPIINHAEARERAISTYRKALKSQQ